MDPQLGLLLDATRPALPLGALCGDEERAVAAALRWGRAEARQVREIAAAAGVPQRRVQDLIEHLILEHEWPIGTSMSRPFGNYLIDSSADLEETTALLHSRALSTLRREAALRRTTLRRLLRELQTELEMEGAGG